MRGVVSCAIVVCICGFLGYCGINNDIRYDQAITQC